MNLKLLWLCLFAWLPFNASTQEASTSMVKGKLLDRSSREPVADLQVTIPYLKLLTTSDANGEFSFAQIPYGTYSMVISNAGINLDTVRFVVAREVVDIGVIKLIVIDATNIAQNALIPTLLLDENNLNNDEEAQNVSGLLSASRDPFVNTATFLFGPYRFQPRGYNRNMQQVFVNGIPMNDVETGNVTWGQWGGLNDVFRVRSNVYGLGTADYAFGGLIGSGYFDASTANQRRQTKATYSIGNRQFRNRVMLTHSSGLMKNGWAYSLSLSKRWAKEGYVAGTFFDASSYYAGISKRIDSKHEFNLIAFGAPTRSGRSSPVVQEVINLTGNNYYNPYWGYQNGEKRNARVSQYFQPAVIFNYAFTPSEKTRWHTSVAYQFGENANSSLDWYHGADPRPDYYRYLPSWQIINFENPDEAEYVKQQWQNEPSVSQINWDQLYQVNYGNYETVQNANGIKGNMVSGRRSVYAVASDVSRIRKYSFNTYLQYALNDHISLYEGVSFIHQFAERYKRLDDLLGGDFFLNYNQFAENVSPGNPGRAQNDLEIPDRVVKEGERYNYNYRSLFTRRTVWGQAVFNYNKLDFFVAVSGGISGFQREGLYRNGLYPENSFGVSVPQRFFTYAAKGGVVYKINGRNYLFANGAIMQDAPTFENIFVSPRTRNQTVYSPSEQKTYSVEAGYLLRAPKINGRLVGYATDLKGATQIKRFYNDDPQFQSFVNYAMQDINTRFTGMEIALEYKLTPTVNLTGVAALGQAFYTNRPSVSAYQDNDTNMLNISRQVYIKDYYLAVGPQSAYSFSVKYMPRSGGFGTLSFNYFDRNYIDVAPDRRSADVADNIKLQSRDWNRLFSQERLPSFFTLDLFVYKSLPLFGSFKFLPRYTSLNLSVGVNNLLDNKNIITGGFEQLRYDYKTYNSDKFPAKYFRGYGRNYFASLSLQF